MKSFKIICFGIFSLLGLSLNSVFAVDDLAISVPSTNAVLSWPSLTNETYVVEYRETLGTNDTWVTLNGNLLAAGGTNLTTFTDPNPLNYGTAGSGGTNGGGIITPPSPGDTNDISDGGVTNAVAGTGFYRVLNVRVTGGLTNGMTASGYINVSVRPESGANYLNLQLNGQSYPGQDPLFPPFTDTNSVTFEDVDTCYLTNGGPYTLQIEGGWIVPNEQYYGSGYETADSQPYAIYVTNELSYPTWESDAGDGWASFNLQSLHTNVDWEIDIYNYYDYLYWYYGYTDTINPIQTVTGSTTNGMIDYNWNLTDADGNVRTNLTTDPAFISFTTASWSGGSAEVANPIIQNDNWPADGGYWVVAYQDIFRNYYDDGNEMGAMFNGWLDMAGDAGNSVFYQTPTSGTNAQTFPIRFNEYDPTTVFYNTNNYYAVGELNDINLLNLMLHDSRARNFYGYGHGHSDAFLGLELAQAELTPMHRYRFVWLDGCNTATGSWDRFFHIHGPGIFDLSHYQNNKLRPAAFVGHTQEIPYGQNGIVSVGGVTYAGSIPDGVPFFRSNFVFYWELENYSLAEALGTAAYNTPPPDQPIVFTQGPLKGTVYNYGDYIQVEGYDQLGWDDYNGATY